jgi:hypothetical protein
VPIEPSPDRFAGSFCVQRHKGDDMAALLGQADAAIDEVKVNEVVWLAFEKQGLTQEWQELCEGIFGPYEEAWFRWSKLPRFIELAKAARRRLPKDAQDVLDDAVRLVERAHQENLPVVFA